MEDTHHCTSRWLHLYALAMTALAASAWIGASRPQESHPRFTEIDVERINVIEPDGKLRMVLSNRPRSIGPIYKGEPFGYPGGGRPGIIFFNDEGTENGGLTFAGRRGADGKFAAASGFSFDQFDQDQVVYVQYNDENGRRNMGLTVADRADVNLRELVRQRDEILKMPEGAARTEALLEFQAPRDGVPLYAQRVYVGRDSSRAALVNLCDPGGRPRLRLQVDAAGEPSLEFLDAEGHVVLRLPEEGK
jgi:hypothetical protein